jgi:hypothetical protein
MRRFFQAIVLLMMSATPLWAQEDKKTDDLKPNDPDTGGRKHHRDDTFSKVPAATRCLFLMSSWVSSLDRFLFSRACKRFQSPATFCPS